MTTTQRLNSLRSCAVSRRCIKIDDGGRVLTGWAQHDDASVAAGREVPDVADAAIERDHHAAPVSCRADDYRILPAAQVFVEHRVNVVAVAGELDGQVVGQVLVELESHAGSGKISSRAKAAP